MYVPVAFRMGDVTLYNRILTGLATRAKDLTVPFTEMGRMLIKDIGGQFLTQGHWAGTPWAQLSDPYRRWKEERYPGRPILVRTGAMRANMLNAKLALHITPDRLIYTPPERTATIHDEKKDASRTYNLAEIAYFQQVGAGHNRVRPMVAIPIVELRDYDRVLIAWLNGREPLSTRP
jgi:hypothetical protein